MGEFPDDILQFVERSFAQKNIQTVFGLLAKEELSTPRVMRAVLYLSNGSLTQLRHFVQESTIDVGAILTDAEYIIGVAEPIRDLSLPFNHERNLEQVDVKRRPTQQNTSPKPKRAQATAHYHPYLAKRRFKLGEAMYSIASTQAHPHYVSCYRQMGKVTSIVTLPLVFVLEQLAERIQIGATNF